MLCRVIISIVAAGAALFTLGFNAYAGPTEGSTQSLWQQLSAAEFNRLQSNMSVWPSNNNYTVESGTVSRPVVAFIEPKQMPVTSTPVSRPAHLDTSSEQDRVEPSLALEIDPNAVPTTASANSPAQATTDTTTGVTTNATPLAAVVPPNVLLSNLSDAQLMQLREQTSARLRKPLVYQPHPELPMFALIPAGRFRMGDIQGGGDFDETPVRELAIAKAFGMSTTEFTFALWDRCVQAGACADAAHQQHGGDKGWGRDDRPVINISWLEVQQQFIPWLNAYTGHHFRLPTEAEWEYAARAGSATAYSVGNTVARGEANFGKNECCGGAKAGADKWEFTAPVGSLPSNAFGLHDMHGNVYEWVYDCYAPSYETVAKDTCSGGKRVARGGSWYDPPAALRSANRVKFSEGFRIIYLGFRLVHVIE